jgi:hypothetical protein
VERSEVYGVDAERQDAERVSQRNQMVDRCARITQLPHTRVRWDDSTVRFGTRFTRFEATYGYYVFGPIVMCLLVALPASVLPELWQSYVAAAFALIGVWAGHLCARRSERESATEFSIDTEKGRLLLPNRGRAEIAVDIARIVEIVARIDRYRENVYLSVACDDGSTIEFPEQPFNRYRSLSIIGYACDKPCVVRDAQANEVRRPEPLEAELSRRDARLLRPSSAAGADYACLLRPARGVQSADTDRLMRPRDTCDAEPEEAPDTALSTPERPDA